jgi:isoquinoline 1-oxidoreductase beta subunit
MSAAISSGVSRRGFLAASASTGLVVAFHIPFAGEAAAQTTMPAEVNAWVVVKPDDSVVIRIARSEMGQGSLTGLAQLVAEELECNWAKVSTEYPTPGQNLARNRAWGNFSTGGSRGIRESQDYVRKGGAAARMMLVQAAAEQWKVPVADCTAANSVITHKPSGRTLTYGSVSVAAGKLAPPDAASITLKDPKDWKLVGKRLARLDTMDKVTGRQVYGADLKLPGMLNAAIKDCPVFGGKVKSFDASVAMKRPGVKKVVRVGDSAVAVVADTWWRAKTALDAMPIEWDNGPNVANSSASVAAMLKAGLDATDAVVGNQNGDAKAALASARADRGGLLLSAPEPRDHGADERDGALDAERCEVWTPTQNGEAALAARPKRRACRRAMRGLQAAPGRRLRPARRGARLGAPGGGDRQADAGTPVKLLWTREEDMLHGRYHPVTQCKLRRARRAGQLTALHMRISGQSILAGVFPQNIQNGKDPVVFQGLNAPGRKRRSATRSQPADRPCDAQPAGAAGFWRGVNLNQNTIYLEMLHRRDRAATGRTRSPCGAS